MLYNFSLWNRTFLLAGFENFIIWKFRETDRYIVNFNNKKVQEHEYFLCGIYILGVFVLWTRNDNSCYRIKYGNLVDYNEIFAWANRIASVYVCFQLVWIHCDGILLRIFWND